jgi:hypothetical protein
MTAVWELLYETKSRSARSVDADLRHCSRIWKHEEVGGLKSASKPAYRTNGIGSLIAACPSLPAKRYSLEGLLVRSRINSRVLYSSFSSALLLLASRCISESSILHSPVIVSIPFPKIVVKSQRWSFFPRRTRLVFHSAANPRNGRHRVDTHTFCALTT